MKLFTLVLLVAVIDGKDLNVETQENMKAVLGGNVTFSCTTHLKDILQVTWQKLNGQSVENVATFSEKFGPNVIGSFNGRAAFRQSEKEVSTIALSGVRLEDEGCYQCLFNTFPTGSNIGKTCLTVHVIPDIHLDLYSIHVSESSEILVVTFSSTGKPAPKIACNVTSNVTGEATESVTVNPNGTVTVTGNFTVVSAESVTGTEVICVINHPATNTEIVKTFTLRQHGVEFISRLNRHGQQ
uniref:OX-2 membrane glycoprotein-like isoform X2 n=1 Tax=Pristiophorus japonicus TaxID=55135 RepID=UPI00398E32CC